MTKTDTLEERIAQALEAHKAGGGSTKFFVQHLLKMIDRERREASYPDCQNHNHVWICKDCNAVGFGGDHTIQHVNANELKTDDSFVAVGSMQLPVIPEEVTETDENH